ncbi:MAG: hypothetical protein R3E66_03400 [bacterium]
MDIHAARVTVSEEKKKKTADEIVDEKAAEMGVDKKKVPASDESAEDVMAGLGIDGEDDSEDADADADEAASDEDAADEDEQDAAEEEEEEEEEVKPAPKKAEKKADKKPEKKAEPKKAEKAKNTGKSKGGSAAERHPGIELFIHSGQGPAPSSSYLEDIDRGDLDIPEKSNMGLYLGIAAGALAIGIGAVLAFGSVEDIGALFRGELRERRLAEKERIEEEYRQEQLAKLDKFGNLMISGNPLYAEIKLNGQYQYGQTSTGEWRELQLGPSTVFQNLNIKKDLSIAVSAPGFKTTTIEMTQGKWLETPSGDFSFAASANLEPVSPEAKQEFDTRLSPDVETEYFGEITISTTPPGANVIFNNVPLMDEKGEVLKTPVTFSKYFVKDEKTGKLEERPVNVDTVLDKGHKVQLQMPKEAGEYPMYVTSLQRQNWTCNWKTEAELKAEKFNPDKDSVQKKCNYTWNFNFDFNNLKTFIKTQEEERKAVEERNRLMQESIAAKAKKEAE